MAYNDRDIIIILWLFKTWYIKTYWFMLSQCNQNIYAISNQLYLWNMIKEKCKKNLTHVNVTTYVSILTLWFMTFTTNQFEKGVVALVISGDDNLRFWCCFDGKCRFHNFVCARRAQILYFNYIARISRVGTGKILWRHWYEGLAWSDGSRLSESLRGPRRLFFDGIIIVVRCTADIVMENWR